MEHKLTVLVVDDDSCCLELMAGILRKAGYRVVTASDGPEALAVHENDPSAIDLLLTDVVMPNFTGPALAQRLRKRQSNLRVLFVSGFHDAEVVQRFVTDKGQILLPKPFTAEALLRVVKEAFTPATR